MNRWKLSALLLSLWVAIIGILTLVLWRFWYPSPYFHAAGADRLMLILMGVQVTLGPLIALIVYKRGKAGMKFDLYVIAILQIAALAYGLNTVLQSRPVFLVAVIDRFNLVSANEIEPADLEEGGTAEFRELSWNGPHLIGARLPPEGPEREQLAMQAIVEGRDVQLLPRYYVQYADQSAEFLSHCQALEALHKKQPGSAAMISALIGSAMGPDTDYCWMPVVARSSDISMILRRADAMPLGAIAIDPW